MKRFVLGALSVLLLALAVFIIPTVWFKPWSIDHYYARVFVRYALRHPTLLTSLGLFDGSPLDFYNDKLEDGSIAFDEKERKEVAGELKMLRSYDRSRMTASQKLSADVLDWFLADQVDGDRFRFHDYPVNQLFGAQSSLPDFMINIHPLKKPKDAENYLKRVGHFGVAIDQVIEQLKAREERGVVPPRFVLDKVLVEMKGFAGKPAVENPLYTNFDTKSKQIAKLGAAKRDAMLASLSDEIEHTVYPAYLKLIEYCTHLQSVATTDDGVWKLPDGAAYYAYRLRSLTTTDLSPDSLHALGVREVARIQDQMRGILREEGYPTKDVATTIRELQKEPRFHYANDDSARAHILADYAAIIEDSERRCDALFDVKPRAKLAIARVPAFKEATAPGAYYQGAAIGGGRPGTFYANLRDPQETAKPAMRTLAYHEGIPGHHFQISIAQELKGVPFFRRLIPFTAYSEGWGLYAERLALENGFHPTPYDSLGALQAELFRAVRLVVDTGIHAQRWTRERAIDYMKGNTGMAETEVVTEIERYIVSPGQACAYKVGQLEILALRARAMEKLGSKFDIKKFHNVVLTHGALPMGLLERVVDEWIASELRGANAETKG